MKRGGLHDTPSDSLVVTAEWYAEHATEGMRANDLRAVADEAASVTRCPFCGLIESDDGRCPKCPPLPVDEQGLVPLGEVMRRLNTRRPPNPDAFTKRAPSRRIPNTYEVDDA